MERELWIAEKMSEYRRLPLEHNTIMFIEGYSFGAGGVVSYLFRKALKDPQYKDCRLVWTVRDYETALEGLGDVLEDKRVMIVKSEMPDYLRTLAVAGTIISGYPLPNFFLKKEGQKVYTYMALGSFSSGTYSRYQLRNFVHTLNDTDKFICLDEYDEKIYLKDYRISPDRIMRIRPEDVFPAREENKKTVLIAINFNKELLESGSSIVAFVKRAKAALSFYDLDVKVFVGYGFWNKFKSQKQFFGIDEIYCDDIDMSCHMNGAALLITDNTYRVTIAQRLGVPVVYWGEETQTMSSSSFFATVKYAPDWMILYQIFEEMFGGLSPDGSIMYGEISEMFKMTAERDIEDEETGTEGDDSENKGADGAPADQDEKDNNVNEDDTDEEDEEDEEDDEKSSSDDPFCRRALFDGSYVAGPVKEKILYVFRWENEEGYLEKMMRWLDRYDVGDREVTVLFLNSANKVLYSFVSGIEHPHLVTCRVGFYQSTPEERQMMTDKSPDMDGYLEETSGAFLVKEWNRVLGNVKYDKVYAENTTNFFWNRMYKYAPTDDFNLLMSKADKDKIFDSVHETLEEQ